MDSFDLPLKSAHVTRNGARGELLFLLGGATWRRLPGSLSGTGRTGSNKDLRARAVLVELGVRRTDNSTQWENTGNK